MGVFAFRIDGETVDIIADDEATARVLAQSKFDQDKANERKTNLKLAQGKTPSEHGGSLV